MTQCRRTRTRRAAWLAFGLVALAGLAVSAHPDASLDVSATTPEWDRHHEPTPRRALVHVDQTTEAAHAFKLAMLTLANLTAHPPPLEDPYQPAQPSFLSSYLPSAQGQGPIGRAMRIVIKLRQKYSPLRIWAWWDSSATEARRRDDESRAKVIKVIDLLQYSAELGHADALYTLAKLSLFPPNIYFPSDPKLAYSYYSTHASLTGNATSQAMLGFFHATGYADTVSLDQAKAMLYYTFAAQGGHKGAQMALAYRYWSGISTLEDCARSVEWYEAAADTAMDMYLSGPPGGLTLPFTHTRLSDLDGGVYGPGASVASTGLNAVKPAVKAGFAQAAGETWEDLLEYYMFNADRGEMDFAYKLGKIFYQGSIYATSGGIGSGSEGVGRIGQDFSLARAYFLLIARQVWPRDPLHPLQHNAPGEKTEGVTQPGWAAKSAAYLGRMYLRGEGVKRDYETAMMWFERGAEYGDRECHNGLGIMWQDGLVKGRHDVPKAMSHFSHAAGQELAEALVNIGKHHYGRGEIKLAGTYFETAIRYGSPFEAHFYLAKIHTMNLHTAGLPQSHAAGSCANAVSFYKLVAERGVWDEDLVDEAEAAWQSDTSRGKEMAILKWWIAAERGSEVAQNNLAYVLDQDRSILRLTRFAPIDASNDTARLALTQWTRSAAQRNIDSLVKVGDYYYHGLGVPDEPESVRWEKAAKYYQSAADTQLSALAMWNLGWMYENGMGVPQDFHLAKRHYDQALETNSEAYLPVLLSLVKLYARSIWHALQGGQDALSLWGDDEDKLSIPEKVHLKREIEGGVQGDGQEERVDEMEDALRDDGSWYMGKAREEYHRRRTGEARREEDEDPVEWARERRDLDGEGDFGPEDDFEGALRGPHRGEQGEEFGETMLVLGLCVGVAMLVYIRTRMVERARREEEEQRQQEGGLFPPPGDAARQDWLLHTSEVANDMDLDLDALERPITRILTAPGIDLSTISAKRVRKTLLQDPAYAYLGLSVHVLKVKRKDVDVVIQRVYERVSGGEAVEAGEGEVEQEPEERKPTKGQARASRKRAKEDGNGEEEPPSKPPKKKKTKQSVEESDAALARKLAAEINSRSRRGAAVAANAGTSTPRKTTKRKPKKSAEVVDSDEEGDEDGYDERTKKKRGGAKGGFGKEYTLSEPLSAVLAVDKLSRPQVVKKLWEYIRQHELQNPSNRKEIVCDDALRAVFSVDKIDMFRMNKVLGQHLHEE